MMACECKGHPFNCYDHPNDCGCTQPKPDSVGIDINPLLNGAGSDSVLAKEIWNAAIEAAAVKINYELGTDELNTYYIEREIRKLKK